MTEVAPPSTASHDGSRRPALPLGVVAAAGLLLLLHFCLAVASKRDASTTSDELVHLTAGVSYWKHHDYRLHPENGILPQRWAALPAWLAGARFPTLADNEYWRTSDAWKVGYQFFYETGEDHFPRLMWARAMIALFSVGTGVLVFCWSWRLFGAAGALVSLTWFTFSPDFLAHGALATSDVCMTFFFLASAWAWWRHLQVPTAAAWWLSALLLGLAFVAKYSAVLLVPVMIATAAVRALVPEPLRLGPWVFARGWSKFAAIAGSAAAHAVVVAGVIWAFYGFRYAAFNPALPPADHFIRPWEWFVGKTGLLGEITRAIAAARLLPEGYLYGFDYVLATTKLRAAFLNGEHSLTGWRTFFLWTFALKTTLPLLFASATVLVLALRRMTAGHFRANLYRATPLLALFAIYWAWSIASQLNIGHRHILPTYPVLFIAAGALGSWLTSRTWARAGVVVGLLAAHAAESIRITPYHLAYFNALAGGPRNGWRHLVDSSLDWGQDLPTLKRWLDAHAQGEPAFLSYFGTGEPSYYGIRARRMTFVNAFNFAPIFVQLEPGVYCVSATILQQVYTEAPGPWTAEREREYQKLRALEPLFAKFNDRANRDELTGEMPVERWHAGIKRHDWLRMARLTSYLRVREPDASAGYSILIYRLSEEEVRAATAGPLSEWHALIEKAVSTKR